MPASCSHLVCGSAGLFQFIKYNTSTESAQHGQTIDQEIEAHANSSKTRTTLILQFPHLLKAFLKYNAAVLLNDYLAALVRY